MHKRDDIRKEQLEDYYLVRGYSCECIGRLLGYSKRTILLRLKDLGISLRPVHQHLKGRIPWNKGKKASDEIRKKLSESHKGHKPSERQRQIVSARSKGNKWRAGCKLSNAHIQRLVEANRGNKHATGNCQSDEQKRMASIRSKARWADPEYRTKISEANRGPNHPQWKGGKSFEPYCFKFNESFKEKIREKFGRKCFFCKCCEGGQRHSIHHIDYNKNSICNGKEWAFLPLCAKHHLKTNFNRWYWFNLLINYWAMNPEINFFEADNDFSGLCYLYGGGYIFL